MPVPSVKDRLQAQIDANALAFFAPRALLRMRAAARPRPDPEAMDPEFRHRFLNVPAPGGVTTRITPGALRRLDEAMTTNPFIQAPLIGSPA